MQTRPYRNYTSDDIKIAAAQVFSMASLLKLLNLKVAGGNYANMKRLLQKLNIDCSHWSGKGWNKEQQLKNWSNYTRAASLKPHLIRLRSHQCEQCQLTTWQNHQIVLEIEHVDGDRTNNKLENLKLLCCNCHSLTKTWRGRKNKK